MPQPANQILMVATVVWLDARCLRQKAEEQVQFLPVANLFQENYGGRDRYMGRSRPSSGRAYFSAQRVAK